MGVFGTLFRDFSSDGQVIGTPKEVIGVIEVHTAGYKVQALLTFIP